MRPAVVMVAGVVLYVMLVAPLAAQEEPAPRPPGLGEWVDRLVERIKTEMQLTDEQFEQIRQQWAGMVQKMQAAGADRESRQAAWEELQSGIRGLLTPEQQKRYDEAQQRLRQVTQDLAATAGLMQIDLALRGLNLDQQTRQRIDDLRQERDRLVQAAVEAFTDRIMPLLTPAQQEEVRRSLAGPARGGFGPGGVGGRPTDQ